MVGPYGALDLSFCDGSRLWLRPGTDVEFVGPRSASLAVVRLHRGEFRANITPDPNTSFRIWTPAGSLKVLGTEFDVRVLPDITLADREKGEAMKRLRSTLRRAMLVVSVLSGAVAVEADGDERIVAEGQRTLVAARSAPVVSEQLQDVDYLRDWLQRPKGNAKA
jgi:ferric-dicitrate binding protein FerR (iron transport regulator)